MRRQRHLCIVNHGLYTPIFVLSSGWTATAQHIYAHKTVSCGFRITLEND